MFHRAVAGVLCLVLAIPAHAEETIPGHEIDRRTSGGISFVAMGIGAAAQLLPIRRDSLWRQELTAFDAGVHDNFSRRAGALSDAMLGVAVAAPALYLMGTSIDDADGDKWIIYGQTIAVNALIAGVTKRLVQRPRPYMYSRDPAVQRFAKQQGDDGFLSFYSGHSALSFGAAVTGAYLLGASGANKTARAFAWSGGLMLASATANLRVRSGKHFYSDVILGSLIGITVGYLVPALHADGSPYKPSGEEIAAGAAGVLGGLLLSSLLPLEKRTSELDATKPGLVKSLSLSPMPVNGGFGFALGGGL
jgi:membrane-associated phospholipid phosphatase